MLRSQCVCVCVSINIHIYVYILIAPLSSPFTLNCPDLGNKLYEHSRVEKKNQYIESLSTLEGKILL